jgi:primosomal protein N' (replication factor Y)
MHCRVQARIVVENVLPDAKLLTPKEKELFDAICKSTTPTTIDSLCRSQRRDSVMRILRQLEKKGVVKRVWELVSPSGKPRVVRGVRLIRKPTADEKLTQRQKAVLDVLARLGRDVPLMEMVSRYSLSAASISSLEKKGLVGKVDLVLKRRPAYSKLEQTNIRLSDEQQIAIDEITAAIESNAYRGYLLFGVTAGGKTEVYLRCIEHALAKGKGCLVLLPEIALTTQIMNIFKSRFGDEVALLHSKLSAGERCDEWSRIDAGEARVVLGARSAVFAPLRNLGLVIVDEEHDSSYKQDIQPRYNGRDTAIQRAQDAGAVVVLGSATPSVETYYNAEQGHYKLLTITKRIENRPMPEVHIADLREEWKRGQATIFSTLLLERIRDRLERRQQVMLLQNRRAYSTFLLCRDCGFVAKCPNCAVSLKLHSALKKLSCHHCDYSRPAPSVCPQCEGQRLKGFGIGTERVEEETKRVFPGARVLRMDRDTTSRKGAHAAILDQFRRHEADILVGTQMIAKGLDFPDVTLVGVISADTSLNLPDFRAAERTFQLISQVAGRAGRGPEPGEVVIQTFDPENYALKCAVNHDYLEFYRQEIEFRRELNYPPFSTIINIVSQDADSRVAKARLDTLLGLIKSTPMSERRGVEIIGPQPAVLEKLLGKFRWHLLIRSKDRDVALSLLRRHLDANQELRRYLTVDVDPTSML